MSAADFSHLVRLSDDTGLFEHARHAVVRRQHGYCTDDVARGLLVTSREPEPSAAVRRLAECCLTFLAHAQSDRGAFRNRLGHDRRWADRPGLGDWWGRAIWGLGTAAAHSPMPWVRQEALVVFGLAADRRSSAPHAMAFAGLGAAAVLRSRPGDAQAADLLRDAAEAVGVPGLDQDWVWPSARLTYASAALAEVVVTAGELLHDDVLLDRGLRMLRWLHGLQVVDGHLSVVPVGGRRRDTPHDLFDQQPIEVAALADAAAAAGRATGDPAWDDVVRQAAGWFRGDNDLGVVMFDPATGGGYDGLTEGGPNLNQGAESTLALISTVQQASALTASAAA